MAQTITSRASDKKIDVKTLYEKDERFKTYMDKYCITRKIPLEETFRHALVYEAAKMYESGDSHPHICL